MIKVLFVVNKNCCHGDCNTVVTFGMRGESTITNHIQSISTLLLVHLIVSVLCEAQLKLIEANRANYILV